MTQNMTQNRKKIIIMVGTIFFIFVSMFIFANMFGRQAVGKAQNYYSGDAVAYGANIVITSVNSGALEVFLYDGGQITRQLVVRAPHDDGDDNFFDSALRLVDGRLYVYTVNGRYLFKYDITDPSQPMLQKKIKKTNWDWFFGVQNTAKGIITIGTKDVSLWNDDMQIIDGYKNINKHAFVNVSYDGRYVFDFNTNYNSDSENDFVYITDSNTRSVAWNGPVVFNKKINRYPYVDASKQIAYIPGDRVLKQVNLTNGSVKNFSHISDEGFAVDSVPGKNYVYFSDGKGIVKFDSNLNVLDSLPINKFNIPLSWSIQIKALSINGSDRVVVFNNSNISIIDENLKVLASYEALADDKMLTEGGWSKPLAIGLSTYKTKRGQTISVAVEGFYPNEEVKIDFNKSGDVIGQPVTVKANGYGEVNIQMTVPQNIVYNVVNEYSEAIDVRVASTVSDKHISTSLNIEE